MDAGGVVAATLSPHPLHPHVKEKLHRHRRHLLIRRSTADGNVVSFSGI